MRREPRRPAPPWIAVAAFLVAALSGCSSDDEVPPPSPTEEQLVRTAFADACDAVERLCGAKFQRRPTPIAVSETEFVDGFVDHEDPARVSLGLEEDDEAAARELAESAWAFYDPKRHTIVFRRGRLLEVASEAAFTSAERLGILRLLFVHEATHALDFERFRLGSREMARPDLEARFALAAVVEGHAEWAAERAAAEWGISALFDRAFSPAGWPGEKDPWMFLTSKPIRPDWAFRYAAGLEFVRAVHAARGIAGVERVLSDPPRSTRAIAMPDTWLDPERDRGGPDTQGAAAAIFSALSDPAWQAFSMRLTPGAASWLRDSLESLHVPRPPPSEEEGHAVVGSVPYGSETVLLALFPFPSEGAAREYLTRARSAQRERDADWMLGGLCVPSSREEADGAGTGRREEGFSVRRVFDAPGGARMEGAVQAFLSGRTVGVLIVAAVPEFAAHSQDRVVSLAAAILAGRPVGERPPPPDPATLAPRGRTLVVRVVDSSGTLVPKAHVALIQGGHVRRRDTRDGTVEYRVPRDASLGVEAWGARAADGTPLPLGWSGVSAVPHGTETVDVRLPAGATIRGTVVGTDGKPVPDALVVAVMPRPDLPEPQEHGRTRSGPDGCFTIVSLARGHYQLRISRPPRYADSQPLSATSDGDPVRVVLIALRR